MNPMEELYQAIYLDVIDLIDYGSTHSKEELIAKLEALKEELERAGRKTEDRPDNPEHDTGHEDS